MNIKDQQAVNQAQRKKRTSDQIEKQNHQLKELVKGKVFENQGLQYMDAETFRKTYEISMKRIRAFLCSLEVLEDVNLSSNAKVLFQIISSLSFNEGYCYASNSCLGKKMGVMEGSKKDI